jgi:hypothetical protein
MKKLILLFLFSAVLLSINADAQQYKILDANNLSTYIYNTGIFDQNPETMGVPGLQWPKNSGKYITFSTGLTIAAIVDNKLRMSSASFKGEYRPGYINSKGIATTDNTFHVYKVSKNEGTVDYPDYSNWGLMVPYGAPYHDINDNGIYDAGIDKPGMPGAAQTIFICLTDGFPESHTPAEGFGGGTPPLKAQVAAIFWAYDSPNLRDIYFAKWIITNKSTSSWHGTYFSLIKDIDIGDANDDYIGCDTNLSLVYSYNGDNMDGNGVDNSYGANPPSVGATLLESPRGLTSATHFTDVNSGSFPCETGSTTPLGAYNMMRGYKKDGTPWIVATSGIKNQTTKFLYTGNPVTGAGWTEQDGSINNCNGSLTGKLISPNSPGNRRIIISSGADNFTVAPGETNTLVMCKIIARGTDNVNSVSQLSAISDDVTRSYIVGELGTVGVTPVSTGIPGSYRLAQNFPNPFNPSTNIRFAIPEKANVKVIVYDALGKEVAVLVNTALSPGEYESQFNVRGLSSGVYYYTLKTENFIETRKMLLLK